MDCIFKSHLILIFDQNTLEIEFRRCCWSKTIKRVPLKDFFKIKDIIQYAESFEEIPCNIGTICNGNCSSSIEKTIKNVQLSITKKCNLNCYHCFHTDHSDIPIVQKVTNFCLNNIKEHNLDSLRSTGLGEPFVDYENFVNQLKGFSLNDFKMIKFFTNGNLLDNKRLKELKNISDLTGINYIFHYSLDAITEDTYKKVRIGGDFNKVLYNIAKTIELFGKNNIFVSFTIKKPNRDEAKAFYSFCKEKFGLTWQVYLGYDILSSEEDDKQIYSQIQNT